MNSSYVPQPTSCRSNSVSFSAPSANSCPVKATAGLACWEVAESNDLFHFTHNICRDCRIYLFCS